MQSESKRCPKCQAPLAANAPQGLCPKCLLAAAAIPTEIGQPVPGDSTPPTLAAVSAAFPHLEILELVGQGGMGFVFKARQPKLDRLVALKILPQSLAADPSFAERFHREARLLARLNHPNIVTVHDFGQAGEFFYLLMEFVDGVNLRQAMKAGRFTPSQALAIVPRICEALQFAHNEGILHRDVKPENILLDAKGRVKIADFGIAKLVGDRGAASPSGELKMGTQSPNSDALTESGRVLGTPNYMAPEQIADPQAVDHRADIYSLGVVFYEMLTGELPVGRFAPPSQKSNADPQVDQVVARALEKEKEKRFDSAEEVKTRVEMIITDAKGQGSQGRLPERRHFFGLHLNNVEKILIIFAVGMLLTYAFNKMVSRDEELGPPEMDPDQLHALNLQPVLPPFGKTQKNPPPAEPSRFTPVMEQTLRFSDTNLSYCLDLESNEIQEIRNGSAHPANYRLPNGISLFGNGGNPKVFYITTTGPVYMAPLGPQRLDSAEANQIIRTIESNANLRTNLITISSVSKRELPMAFLFQTSRGHIGAFEITRLASDQNAAQIRYKLIPDTNWPAKFQSVFNPATVSKPISREAVALFNRSQELDRTIAGVGWGNISSDTKWVPLLIQSEENWNKFNALITGTAVEEPARRVARLSAERSQVSFDDQDNWVKLRTRLEIAEFDRNRLMLSAAVSQATGGKPPAWQLSPWIEVNLRSPSEGTNYFVDLDTAKPLTPPLSVIAEMPARKPPAYGVDVSVDALVLATKETNAFVRWILSSGADAALANPHDLVMICPMGTSRIADQALNPDWEQKISPEWVGWELERQQASLKQRGMEGALGSIAEFEPAGLLAPNLCLFHTRSGGVGILQIARSTDNPPGAKVRYKLFFPK